MDGALHAGAARRIVSPPLGIGKIGGRLFGDPIQWIESDLTATVLVLGGAGAKVAIVALDLCTVETRHADALRADVAEAIGVPATHVLLNESHDHSAPALPGYYAGWYAGELENEYLATLRLHVIEAAADADGGAAGRRGSAAAGARARSASTAARSATANGCSARCPTIPSTPPWASSASTTRVATRSRSSSATRPTPSRWAAGRQSPRQTSRARARRARTQPRRPRTLPPGLRRQHQPTVGIGYEVDCRDTKNRIGLELGGEALKVAAGIRTNTRAGERRPLGNVPNILFTPWEPVDGHATVTVAARETTIELEYVDLPPLADAEAILERWQAAVEQGRAGLGQEWELRVAVKMEAWARRLLTAVRAGGATFDLRLQAVRLGDVVLAGMNVETFFETGIEIRRRSPRPDTFVLGYTGGSMAYLPRAEDHPEGGWKLDERYALPDWIPQFYPGQVTALHPGSERRALDGTLALIHELT